MAMATGALSLLAVSCSESTASAQGTEEKAEMNEGQQLVMDSIAAHGGTEKWYDNGLLQFRWVYHMTDRGPKAIVDTSETIDPRNLNVVHEVTGKDIKFGMNGGKAWISPKGTEFKPPVRFWSHTPFYFMGIPFVFNDEKANFELLGEKMEFEGKEFTQVKVTYDKDAGDSPDDYYVLLIDPETKVTRGAYYTVTNKLVAVDGVGPAKFISLDNLQDVNGIQLSSGHRTFSMNDGKIAEQMRFTEVSDVKWAPRGSVDLSIPSDDLIIE